LFLSRYEDADGNVHRPALAPGAASTFIYYLLALDMIFLECSTCNLSSPSIPTAPHQISAYKKFYGALFGMDFSEYVFDGSRVNLSARKYNAHKDANGWKGEDISGI